MTDPVGDPSVANAQFRFQEMKVSGTPGGGLKTRIILKETDGKVAQAYC